MTPNRGGQGARTLPKVAIERIIRNGKSACVADTRSRSGRFESDLVVDRISESLLAAQIPLRRLDGHMTEQELDLFKLPASFMTQARACAPQVVRSNMFKTAF